MNRTDIDLSEMVAQIHEQCHMCWEESEKKTHTQTLTSVWKDFAQKFAINLSGNLFQRESHPFERLNGFYKHRFIAYFR